MSEHGRGAQGRVGAPHALGLATDCPCSVAWLAGSCVVGPDYVRLLCAGDRLSSCGVSSMLLLSLLVNLLYQSLVLSLCPSMF